MRKIFQLILLLTISFSNTAAIANSFDPETNTLTMNSVTAGDQQYLNVVIRIDQFTVLGVGGSMSVSSGIDAGDIVNTFDPETNTLTMNSVTAGDQQYLNVVIRIDQFTVLGVGGSMSVNNGISELCGPEHFSIDKYNAIQVGMSLDQVNQIIGCKGDEDEDEEIPFKEYEWYTFDPSFTIISVFFDPSTLTVTGSISPFKGLGLEGRVFRN